MFTTSPELVSVPGKGQPFIAEIIDRSFSAGRRAVVAATRLFMGTEGGDGETAQELIEALPNSVPTGEGSGSQEDRDNADSN